MKKFLTFSFFFVLCIWHKLPRFAWREAEYHETWRRTQRRRCVRHCCCWWRQYYWASVGSHPLLACLPPRQKSSSPFSLSFFLSLWNWLKEILLRVWMSQTDETDKTCFDEVSPTQIVNCGLLCNLYIYRERERESTGKKNCVSLFFWLRNFGGNLKRSFIAKAQKNWSFEFFFSCWI